MSIMSSYSQELDPDFTDLLAHHPGLAGWLSEILQSKGELRAEELLPDFLSECASQGISGEAYPFTAEGWGLRDLRAYLQRAQAEIEAFSTGETPPPVAGESEQDKSDDKRKEELADLPTQSVPALEPPAVKTTSVDQAETESMPVVELPAENRARKEESADESAPTTQPTEVAERDTALLAALNAKTTDTPTAERDTAMLTAIDAETTNAQTTETDTAVLPAIDPQAAGQENTQVEGTEKKDEQEQTETVTPRDAQNPSSSRRKRKRARRPRTRRQRIISWALLLLILASVLIPGTFLIGFGINAYTTYHELSSQAHSAVNQLLAVKAVFSGGKSHYSNFLDPARLRQAQKNFAASEHDFQQIQNELKHSDTLKTITTYLPQYQATLSSALAASSVGIDVARIGQTATANAIQIAPNFSGPLLAASGKPLITQPVLNTITSTINQIQPLLNDILAQTQKISLDSLPISATEKGQAGQLLQVLPQTLNDLGVVRNLLGTAGWLLGVDHPRTFLVQTMDRAELRGTGGFTGQYGELKINGGRVAPFTLTDIGQLEYNPSSANQGQQAPEQYRSWWPFANWGLRDSNISADFPTSAQVALDLYKQETGNQVDGLISFTPVVIEHILAIIGPIQVPGYNTTVTAQNLENVLHYYQLDNGGILKQYLVNQGNNGTSTSDRKRFTSYLTSLLLSKVRKAPLSEIFSIAHQVLDDLQTKDLQVYFTDPAAEHILTQYGYAARLDRSTTHDGLYVVQENLSASKASQYVKTIMHDTVTLDSQGGATHVLQIRLVYNQAGPVYGYDTYYDYLRVYVPPKSHLISGDGFSSGTPLCGGSYGDCPVNGVYPGDELICPAGQYQPGASPPSLTGSDGGSWQPLQTLSGPTNTTSDEPGRAMYGGWVIVPKNCTMTVTLSWYVPPMSQHGYALFVQRQAGTFPELDLSILPDAASCARLGTAGLRFDGILLKDSSFTPPAYKPAKQGAQSCYPHSGV